MTIPRRTQVVIVGLGASIGREVAPREAAAALSAWISDRLGLTPEDLSPRTHTVRTTGYVTQRRNIRHEGTPAEIAESLVRALEQDGILA